LKISEGCNHRCAFCIIPSLRGDLVSRRPDAILREAEKLIAAGTKELLVISQDTSAYGVDIRHHPRPWKGGEVRAHMTDLARELGRLGAWVRLHYVYPYPHVDQVIPLMGGRGWSSPISTFPSSTPRLRAEGHEAPCNQVKVLERLRTWREVCPDIAIRSSSSSASPARPRPTSNICSNGSKKPSSTASAPSVRACRGRRRHFLPDPSQRK
jgi:ribosomal protein S12 methylthiotransferase